MITTIKKWGNSYALRLTKKDLQQMKVRPGQRVDVLVQPATGARAKFDVSQLPTLHDPDGLSFQEAQEWAAMRKRRWEA